MGGIDAREGFVVTVPDGVDADAVRGIQQAFAPHILRQIGVSTVRTRQPGEQT